MVGYCGPGQDSQVTLHLFYFEEYTLLRYLNWIWRIDARKMRELKHVLGEMIEKLDVSFGEEKNQRNNVSSLFKYSKDYHMEEG